MMLKIDAKVKCILSKFIFIFFKIFLSIHRSKPWITKGFLSKLVLRVSSAKLHLVKIFHQFHLKLFHRISKIFRSIHQFNQHFIKSITQSFGHSIDQAASTINFNISLYLTYFNSIYLVIQLVL